MNKQTTHPATSDQPAASPMSDQQATSSASIIATGNTDQLSNSQPASFSLSGMGATLHEVFWYLLRDKQTNIEAGKNIFAKIGRLQPPTGFEKQDIKYLLQDYIMANVSAQIEECQIYSRHLFKATQQAAEWLKDLGLSWNSMKAEMFCGWFYDSLLPNNQERTAESETIKLAGNYLIDCLYMAMADEPTTCFDIDIIERLKDTFSPCFIDSVSYYDGIRHEYMKAKAMGYIGDQKQDITTYCDIMKDEAKQFEIDSKASFEKLHSAQASASQPSGCAPSWSDQQQPAGKPKPKREKTKQIQLSDEQKESLGSFFTMQFKGSGRNENYFKMLIDDLQKQPYNTMQIAAIALLIYRNNEIWTADKPTTFAKWYKSFCEIIEIETGKYKPTIIAEYIKGKGQKELNFYYLKPKQ